MFKLILFDALLFYLCGRGYADLWAETERMPDLQQVDFISYLKFQSYI